MANEKLDPILRDILGETQDDSVLAGEDTGLDPVGNWRHQIQYGIPAPGADPSAPIKKLSVVEISDALNKVRQAIGGSGKYAERLRKLNLPLEAMAASASEYLPEGSPAIAFLQGAAAGDDAAMKRALRRMVEDAPIQ